MPKSSADGVPVKVRISKPKALLKASYPSVVDRLATTKASLSKMLFVRPADIIDSVMENDEVFSAILGKLLTCTDEEKKGKMYTHGRTLFGVVSDIVKDQVFELKPYSLCPLRLTTAVTPEVPAKECIELLAALDFAKKALRMVISERTGSEIVDPECLKITEEERVEAKRFERISNLSDTIMESCIECAEFIEPDSSPMDLFSNFIGLTQTYYVQRVLPTYEIGDNRTLVEAECTPFANYTPPWKRNTAASRLPGRSSAGKSSARMSTAKPMEAMEVDDEAANNAASNAVTPVSGDGVVVSVQAIMVED